jgi:outer membrane protein assembly factor BamB
LTSSATDIALMPDGGVVVVGSHQRPGMDLPRNEGFVRRLDVDGAELWTLTLAPDAEGYAYANAVETDAGGRIFVLTSNDSEVQHNAIAELDDDGGVIWETRYDELALDVFVDADGLWPAGMSGINPWIAHFDLDGALVEAFSPPTSTGGFGQVRALHRSPDGTVYAVGREAEDLPGNPEHGFALALDAVGTTIWHDVIDPEMSSESPMHDVTLAPNGDVLVVGEATIQGPEVRELMLLRYTASPDPSLLHPPEGWLPSKRAHAWLSAEPGGP